MKRSSLLPSALAFALGMLLLGAPLASAQVSPAPPAGITVTGIGTATAPAEVAIVALSVGFDPYMYGEGAGWSPYPGEVAAPGTPADVIAPIITADDIARPIVDALVTAGFPADDIEVISNPYAGGYGPYGAPLEVTIRFKVPNPTISGLETMLAPALQAAAATHLSVYMTSVVYGIADCAPLHQEARDAAVADALEQANQQALALGRSLGDVVASRDTPAALYSGPWYGPVPLNACTPGAQNLAAVSTWGGPMFDPQQPAEVTVQTAIEVTYDLAAGS